MGLKTAILAVIFAFLWSSVGVIRYLRFESASHDLGLFTNVMWNLTNGHGHISSILNGINLFLDHQDPILWIIAPLFKIFPSPITLLILQGSSLALAGPALYFVARQYLGSRHWFIYMLPLLYWNYLLIRNANAFEFHPIKFLPFFFLWGIAGAQSQSHTKRVLGIISLLLCLTVKESVGPLLVALSLAWLLGAGPKSSRAFTKRLSLYLIPLSITVFIFNLFIIPKIIGGEYRHFSAYDHIGGTLYDILLYPLTNPMGFFEQVFTMNRLKFLIWLLAPLSFIPLINWRGALVSLPPLLMLFLQNWDNRFRPEFYYGIEPCLGLFYAFPLAVLSIEKFMLKWKIKKAVLAGLIIIGTVVFGSHSEIYRFSLYQTLQHHSWLKKHLVPSVNPSSTLSTTAHLAPSFSTRYWIKNIPDLKTQSGYVDCIIHDSALNNWPIKKLKDQKKFISNLSNLGYSLIYSCDSVRIFKKENIADNACLLYQPKCIDYSTPFHWTTSTEGYEEGGKNK